MGVVVRDSECRMRMRRMLSGMIDLERCFVWLCIYKCFFLFFSFFSGVGWGRIWKEEKTLFVHWKKNTVVRLDGLGDPPQLSVCVIFSKVLGMPRICAGRGRGELYRERSYIWWTQGWPWGQKDLSLNPTSGVYCYYLISEPQFPHL